MQELRDTLQRGGVTDALEVPKLLPLVLLIRVE
jgi:hypothetical protein